MLNIEIITSFNQTYYDLIGKDATESWLKYWPKDMTLTCYVEGFKLSDAPRIKQIPFEDFEKEYFEFQETSHKQVKKFAKKAWSFIHAMYNSDADRIIWLDADLLHTNFIDREFIESLLPKNVLSTHMGVTYQTDKNGSPGRWFVPETGFFAINTKHKLFDQFKTEYRRHYVEQDYQMLRRFFDNDVYGYVFEQLEADGLDLCKHFTKPYKTPMRHTVLGPYMEHYKAKHSKAEFNSDD